VAGLQLRQPSCILRTAWLRIWPEHSIQSAFSYYAIGIQKRRRRTLGYEATNYGRVV